MLEMVAHATHGFFSNELYRLKNLRKIFRKKEMYSQGGGSQVLGT